VGNRKKKAKRKLAVGARATASTNVADTRLPTSPQDRELIFVPSGRSRRIGPPAIESTAP